MVVVNISVFLGGRVVPGFKDTEIELNMCVECAERGAHEVFDRLCLADSAGGF